MSESPKGNGHAAAEPDPGDADAPPAQPTGLAAVESPAPPDPLEALRGENADLRDQLLRRRADFENFRKRSERERAAAGHDAVAELLRALVPVLDNFERALSAPGDTTAALREGVVLIQRGLVTALEAHGLRAEDPTGQPFDPQVHQALSYDEAPGMADGTVKQTFGRAYFHRERLLRPALVVVARGAAAEPGTDADASEEALHS